MPETETVHWADAIGKPAYESIRDMVAALECEYCGSSGRCIVCGFRTGWTNHRLAVLESWADNTARVIDQLPRNATGSARVERGNNMRLYARIVAAIFWLRARQAAV